MFELELEIMLIRIGAETYFFDNYLGCVGLHLLGALTLLIQVFLVIQNLAYGRVCFGADLYQVQFQFLGQCKCLGEGIDTLFRDIVTHQTHLGCGYFTVNPEGEFVLGITPLLLLGLFLQTRGPGFERRSDSYAPLKVKLTGPVLLPQPCGHIPQTEARSWNPGPRLHGVQIQIPLPVLFLLR